MMCLAASVLGTVASSAVRDRSPLKITPVVLTAIGQAAQPNVVFDPKRETFVLSWQAKLANHCHALRVSELSLRGELGAVHEVARGCDWFINWADFPSIVVADNGDWIAHWLQKINADTYAYEIRVVRSRDHGKSWSAPLVVHHDNTATEHGFVAMAPLAADRVLLSWLDGRQMASAQMMAIHEHAHDASPSMTLRTAVLDRRGRLSEQRLADARVCSCCNNDLVRTENGEHWLSFRDNSAENLRDFGLLRRTVKGWQATTWINNDAWKISGCPVNGAALAASGNTVLAVWPTMGQSEVLSVRAKVLGASSYQTLAQGAAVLGRVDASTFSNGWLISWVGASEPGIQLAQYDIALKQLYRHSITQGKDASNVGIPRMAAHAKHALLVWTEGAAAVRGQTSSQLRAVVIQTTR
jgi:hypothetical protein